ncbi:DUF5777 family beta-barrel protein [Pedobacter sp. KR3-3]|uniref:DUF5777 family beta-barrel protein n=1 Tax=Pedobacter albus TaxID=3113905 RepID=A0ABU7I9C1_9SPHI|nr:DUF5777 family beta-barrel protein [Pedobacter sp. KR3-3]MEE1946077.1 DUF5777 family beta-barrel protein [Pedobacter sp. KR3-3]
MKKSKLLIYLILVLALLAMRASAQTAETLLGQLDSTKKFNKVEATFKATHVVLSHSTETQKKHDLDLRIRHHFGDIGGEFGSAHTLYGLDVATDLFIGLDYGLTDNLTIGFGRSKHDELFNLYVKQKLLQQTSDGSMPINLTFLAQAGLVARKPFTDTEFANYGNRLSYLIQPIFSRKFSQRISLEVMPAFLIRSVTADPNDPKNLFTLGFAGRIKLTKRLSFVADYTLVNGLSRPSKLAVPLYNPLGVGLEIETGGHIFSLNFMNSEYINENSFIANTKKSWTDGGVRFGFTISRNFSLFKSKNPDTKSTIY